MTASEIQILTDGFKAGINTMEDSVQTIVRQNAERVVRAAGSVNVSAEDFNAGLVTGLMMTGHTARIIND